MGVPPSDPWEYSEYRVVVLRESTLQLDRKADELLKAQLHLLKTKKRSRKVLTRTHTGIRMALTWYSVGLSPSALWVSQAAKVRAAAPTAKAKAAVKVRACVSVCVRACVRSCVHAHAIGRCTCVGS